MNISVNRVLRHGKAWACLALPCAALFVLWATPVRAAERQTLRGHIPAAVAGLAPVGRLPASQSLNLAIGLPLRNQQALTNLLHDLYDPASPQYHHYLTPQQFAAGFGPTEADYQAVLAFAKTHGLTVTGTQPNRTLLNVQVKVADIETLFNVRMLTYKHPHENRQFFAPDAAPSLDLATPILAINGLNNYILPRPLFRRQSDLPSFNGQSFNGSGPQGSYMGYDFRDAYVPGTLLTGTGQSVALFECNGYFPSDITAYVAQAGLPTVPLQNVLVDGGPPPPFPGDGANVEVALDIEMANCMAPGLSKIIVYEGPTDDPVADLDILNRIATDNLARQISSSWLIGDSPQYAQIYMQFAAQGQSFLQACGDECAYYPGIFQFEDSPLVTLVGGTTLSTTGPLGSWQSETVWNWGGGSGTGGGISQNYSIPVWQQGINMTTNQGSTTMRNIPDVALTADNVYVVADDGQQEPGIGGTSCAAPLWAAFTALINQQGAAGGQAPLGFLNYALYAIGKGSTYPACFHDITTGNNTSPNSPNLFFAVPGYDLCTGWGTPGGTNLINALASPGQVPSLVVISNYLFGGNGNGLIDTNECNSLNLTLANVGNATATGVSATIFTTTPEAAIAQATSAYPNLPVDASAVNLVPFKISTSPSFICGTPINLSVLLQCDQSVSSFQLTLPTGSPGTPVRFDNSSPVPIPSPGTTNSTIFVSGIASALDKVTVSMYVPEFYDNDLQLELIGPDGTTNLLCVTNEIYGENLGVACSPDSQRTTFDDAAATPIAFGAAPFTGSFQPAQPLAVFAGKSGTSVNGLWQLRATDSGVSDLASIQCWSLFITPAFCLNGGGQCPGADMALGMTAQPNPVVAGNNLTYSIAVTNFGPNATTNVTVACTFPASMTFVSAASSQGSYSLAGGGVIVFSLGPIALRGTATMTVVMQPTATGIAYATATVSSEQPDPNPFNNTAIVPVLVDPASVDLAVGIAAAPSSIILGGSLTYTISVTNNGPNNGTGVFVTNVLPASAAVLSATISQGSITTGGALWTLGHLASGAKATATIVVLPTAAGTITASATVTGKQFDPNPANNTASVSTVVGPAADLAIGIAEAPNPAVVGSNVTYLVSVTNLGPSAATSVTVNYSLSPDLTVLTTNVSQGVAFLSGAALTWDLGTLTAGAKATLTIVASTTTNETLVTSATVTANEADPNPANNSATSTVVVAAPFVTLVADGATLTYQSGPTNGAINIGETVTAVLRVLNTGNVSTRNLVGTLSATNGVAPIPPTSQIYGVLAPSGFPGGRPFTFTASGTNGQTIYPTLQLVDGASNYVVTFAFTLPNTQSFANTNAILIPDPAAPNPPYPLQSGPAKPYPSVINISNYSGVLGKVTVTLSNLSHTFPGDINALLVAPNGANTLLMSHAGDAAVTGLNLTFDDSSTNWLPDESGEMTAQMVSGVWHPTAYSPPPQLGGFPANAPAGPYVAQLSALYGVNPNGAWSLYVFDDSAGDAGSISNGWSLALTSITPVNLIADLGLTAVATPSTNLLGGTFTYTFTITNAGPNTATDVSFTNVPPAGVTLVSVAASQGNVLTATAANVIVILGTLNAGAAATVSEVVTVTAAAIPSGKTSGLVTNVANVAADQADLSPVNASVANISTVNLPVVNLGLAQSVAPTPVVAGYTLTNTVVITNLGPGTAFSVVLTDPLPTNTTLASVTSTVGSGTNTGGTVTCSLGDLAANSGATVTVVLIPSSPSVTDYVYTNSLAQTNISTVYTNAAPPWYIHATNILELTNTLYVATASQNTNAVGNSVTTNVLILSPAADIIGSGALLTYESGPVNGAIDPGETVTLSLGLANIGSLSTTNLVATLLATNGVTSPKGINPAYPTNIYGALINGNPSTARSFTFTAASVLSNGVIATLQLQDGSNNLGAVAFAFGAPATNYFTNLAGIIIPDHGAGTPYPAVINVSGVTGRVSKAAVTLNGLSHTFPHDVNVVLVSPSGSNVLVMSHTGGGYPVSNVDLTFSDAAANYLPNSTQITSGTYKPSSYEGPFQLPDTLPSLYQFALSGLNWSSPNGAWSLYVFDDKVGDDGIIAGGWSLNLTTIMTVGPVVDLAVSLSVPASLQAGATLTNTINVTNFGPDSASGVVLTLTNPPSAGVQFLSASLSQGSLAGTGSGFVSCNLGSLAAGASANVVILTVPSVAGALTNTVNLAANEEDLNLANNTAQGVTTVSGFIPATLAGSIVNHQLRLTVTAQANFAYVVQVSTNLTLTDWVSLSTNTSTTGTFQFTDTNTPALQPRFYRTLRLTP